MRTPLAFLEALDKAYRSADPAAALTAWFTELPGALDKASLAHYERFLRAVGDVHRRNHGEPAKVPEAPTLGLCLERAGACLVTGNALTTGVILTGDGLTPGDYRLVTTTGWVLWEAALTMKDLSWSSETPLALAAASEQAATTRPSMEFALLDGELRIAVYPGPEFGYLEITRHGC